MLLTLNSKLKIKAGYLMDVLTIRHLALLVAIFATILYQKYSSGRARYFLFSIWLIAVVEFLQIWIHNYSEGKIKILFIANTYILLQFSFYLLWYRSLLLSKKRRLVILILCFLFISFFAFNAFFIQDFYLKFQTYSYALGVLLTTISIFSFFVEFLRSERIIKFERSIYFWFSLGILLFHIPFLPFQYTAQYFDFFDNKIYLGVVNLLNILMHTCFLVGILWSQKKYNS